MYEQPVIEALHTVCALCQVRAIVACIANTNGNLVWEIWALSSTGAEQWHVKADDVIDAVSVMAELIGLDPEAQ